MKTAKVFTLKSFAMYSIIMITHNDIFNITVMMTYDEGPKPVDVDLETCGDQNQSIFRDGKDVTNLAFD